LGGLIPRLGRGFNTSGSDSASEIDGREDFKLRNIIVDDLAYSTNGQLFLRTEKHCDNVSSAQVRVTVMLTYTERSPLVVPYPPTASTHGMLV
jgi:hypothetical protein